jgi:hypothetical protein
MALAALGFNLWGMTMSELDDAVARLVKLGAEKKADQITFRNELAYAIYLALAEQRGAGDSVFPYQGADDGRTILDGA